MVELEAIVSKEWVMTGQSDLQSYRDDYGIFWGHSELEPKPSAAVAPASTDEVQAVVRILNKYQLPCWTISTGKNLGYGGAAPLKNGMITIDLKRMNRIIEVNEKHAYAIVEPGVSYFDLFNYIRDKGYKLWMSCPSPGWGSIIGNTSEHGVGYTPYGDHYGNQCGLEVVLPDGDLLRTGMGAMPDTKTWGTFKYGFGPHIDGMFTQSNLGIVTRMGIWLMPEPPTFMTGWAMMDGIDDFATMIEATRDLRQQDIITNMATVFPGMMDATYRPESGEPLRELIAGRGSPMDLIKILKEHNLGFWTNRMAFYGLSNAVKEKYEYMMDHYLAHNPKTRFKFDTYSAPYDFRKMDAGAKLQAGVPNLGEWTVMGWTEDSDAHAFFSPIIPFTGEAAQEHVDVFNEIFTRHGRGPYIGSIALFNTTRTCMITIPLPVRKGDHEFNRVSQDLFLDLVQASTERGWGDYRAPTFAMDTIMDTYSFNNHALRRFHERIKDTLDPNGIFSPGKNGIWPERYRDTRVII
tara:strand:+ start:2900 stop:4459 length:1560 start_codon:yes stop_codon:yes gene_type:complete